MKNRLYIAASTSTLAVAASTAFGQHAGDIFLENIDGQLTTGLRDETTTIHDHRAFPSEFGEFFENFTDEPGFDSDIGEFTPGTNIGFNVLDAVRVWDGQNFDTMSPVTFTISYSGFEVETGSGFVEGFALPVNSNGEFHRHLNYVINDRAPTGVYLLQLQLWSDDPGLRASEPFYIVFNQEEHELIHDQAVEWVAATLVPGIHFHDVDLDAGRRNEFTLLGATPGQRVYFVHGFQFGNTNIPGCPGVGIGIRRPAIMGSGIVDGSGAVTISRFVPSGASGRTVLFGAVEQGTCTVANIVEHTFP